MTRYEKQLQEMTIEKMAMSNVREYQDDEIIKWYETSDNTIFAYFQYDEALAHEIEWLKGEE